MGIPRSVGYEGLSEADQIDYLRFFGDVYETLFRGSSVNLSNVPENAGLRAAYNDASRLIELREMLINKTN